MAYKEMKTIYYLIVTLIFYAIIVVGSIFILDITTIFDFASAIAVTAIAFLFPGWFYLLAVKEYGEKVPEHKKLKCYAYMFLVLTVLNFVLGMYSSIYSVITGEGGE